MPEKEAPPPAADAVLRSFAIHNRIHLYLLDAIPAEAWHAAPPGGKGPDSRRPRGAHPRGPPDVAQGNGRILAARTVREDSLDCRSQKKRSPRVPRRSTRCSNRS